jgi:hypothetical protein
MAKPSDLLKKMDRSVGKRTPIETSPDATGSATSKRPSPEEIQLAEQEERLHRELQEAAEEESEPEPVVPPAVPKVRPSASAPHKTKQSPNGRLPRRLPGPIDSTRMSVDLDRERRKQLKQFGAVEAEIDDVVVVRTLIDLMFEDAHLAKRVKGRIVEMKQAYVDEQG